MSILNSGRIKAHCCLVKLVVVKEYRENEMKITFCDRCGLLTHERKRPNGDILCESCYEGKRPKPSRAADSQTMAAVLSPSPEQILKAIQRGLKKD